MHGACVAGVPKTPKLGALGDSEAVAEQRKLCYFHY